MGDVQGGQISLDDTAAELRVGEIGDATEKARACIVTQIPVPGVGAEDPQITSGIVGFVPTVMAGGDLAEHSGVFDLRGPVLDFAGSGRPLVVFWSDDLRRFALVDTLYLLEEFFADVAVHVHVPEQGEGTSLSEGPCDPGIG